MNRKEYLASLSREELAEKTCSGRVTVTEACNITGLIKVTIQKRLRAGWTAERIFNPPRSSQPNKSK